MFNLPRVYQASILFPRSVVLVRLSINGAASISLLASLGPSNVTDLGAHNNPWLLYQIHLLKASVTLRLIYSAGMTM